jgi:hypothetical protein
VLLGVGITCAPILRVMVTRTKDVHMIESTWKELCKQIVDEDDPQRLMSLVEALNKELEKREQQLYPARQQALAQE